MTSGRTPQEVREALAGRIGNGSLRRGQRLGAERTLAAELGVSRATLGRALGLDPAGARADAGRAKDQITLRTIIDCTF